MAANLRHGVHSQHFLGNGATVQVSLESAFPIVRHTHFKLLMNPEFHCCHVAVAKVNLSELKPPPSRNNADDPDYPDAYGEKWYRYVCL